MDHRAEVRRCINNAGPKQVMLHTKHVWVLIIKYYKNIAYSRTTRVQIPRPVLMSAMRPSIHPSSLRYAVTSPRHGWGIIPRQEIGLIRHKQRLCHSE